MSVAILGLGAVSPNGVGVEALDREPLVQDDARWPEVTTRVGRVPDFKPRKLLPDRKAIKVMSRDSQLAVVAAMEACGGLEPAARLGIEPQDYIRSNYRDLQERFAAERGQSEPGDMVF